MPIPLVDLNRVVAKDWDLVLQAIKPYLDGNNYVKKACFFPSCPSSVLTLPQIQQLASVESESLKKALQHLLYYKCIVLGDIFQYSNMYRVTAGIHALARDKEMQAQCVRAATLADSKPPPAYALIFALYCQLQPGVTLLQVRPSFLSFFCLLSFSRTVRPAAPAPLLQYRHQAVCRVRRRQRHHRSRA